MPLYSFESKDGKYEDIFFTMKDVPSIGAQVVVDGVTWTRICTKPQASFATQINAFDKNQFVRSLDNKNETMGSIWDRSAELSAIRAEKNGGVDPVKEKYYDNYAKKRHGQRHPNEQKEKSAKKLEEMGISVKINT